MERGLKKILVVGLVLLFSCNEQQTAMQKIQSATVIQSVPTICEVQRSFGDINVCLPNIEGYIECLANKYVKERVDDEVKALGEEVLGIYLRTELYTELIKNPNKTLLDDYIKIYSSPPLKNKKVPNNFFKQMAEKIEKESDIVQWDEAIQKIHNNNSNLLLGKPLLLEHSKYHPQTDTYIYLGSYNTLGKSGYILWTANLCIIKERLIYFANYINYASANSMEILKNKNLLVMKEFMRLNQ